MWVRVFLFDYWPSTTVLFVRTSVLRVDILMREYKAMLVLGFFCSSEARLDSTAAIFIT